MKTVWNVLLHKHAVIALYRSDKNGKLLRFLRILITAMLYLRTGNESLKPCIVLDTNQTLYVPALDFNFINKGWQPFRGICRTQLNIYDEAFYENCFMAFSRHLFSQKSSLIDVTLGSKYTSGKPVLLAIILLLSDHIIWRLSSMEPRDRLLLV